MTKCHWYEGGGGGGEGRGCGDVQRDPLPVLLVLGVASGFSVWVIPVSLLGEEGYMVVRGLNFFVSAGR